MKYKLNTETKWKFQLLDTLKSTYPGLNGLPSWFLRLSAPFITQPLTYLFNQSLAFSYVPPQWKLSIITAVPKVAKPTTANDFRPISVTPILSRILERLAVKKYLYPILDHSQYSKYFPDQFAFRPKGSTTVALINLNKKITDLFSEHPYVHLISLDFSKAFDTVRHSTLSQKLSFFPLPFQVHNCTDRQHCTKYNSLISDFVSITLSIVQGSVIGPVMYDINSNDRDPVNQQNSFNKYADDTYLLVSSAYSHTIQAELDHVNEWADRLLFETKWNQTYWNQTWESFVSAQLTWLDPKMTWNQLEVDLLTIKWLDLIEILPTFDLKVTRHFIIIDFTLHKNRCVVNIWEMVLPIKVSKFVTQ